MSVVAARKYPDRIEVAADSQYTAGQETKYVNVSNVKKLHTLSVKEWGEITIGLAGKAKEMAMMLAFLPRYSPRIEPFSVVALLRLMKEFGDWVRVYDPKFKVKGHWLFVVGSEVYSVSGTEIEEINEYIAIGTGLTAGMAAMFLGHTPADAVRAACHISACCGGPVVTHTIQLGANH